MRSSGAVGLMLALASAVMFGTSGTFAAALIQAGWSPGAAVTCRIALAALLLTVPAVIVLRGKWDRLWVAWRTVVVFGLLAVAGCQFFYFNAVATLSVGVALLLEYLGVLFVVVWLWVRHGKKPRRPTVAGAAVAVVGLILVLDLTGARIDLGGVAWGPAAAVGLAVYFVLSAKGDGGLPPIALAWGGMSVGAVALVLLSLTGVLPFEAPLTTVTLAGSEMPWWVPLSGLAVVAGVLAYSAGIGAARLLGATVASFVGLTEVVAAVAIAWVLLGQAMTAIQLAGGALIIGGVILVRWDELRDNSALPSLDPEPLPVSAPQN